jgi:hypothetical protein
VWGVDDLVITKIVFVWRERDAKRETRNEKRGLQSPFWTGASKGDQDEEFQALCEAQNCIINTTASRR